MPHCNSVLDYHEKLEIHLQRVLWSLLGLELDQGKALEFPKEREFDA